MGGLGNAHHAVLIAACDAGATSFLVFSRMAEEKRATMLLKLRKMGAGRMEINAGHVRRGIQFLVNIGTPLVVGALRGEVANRARRRRGRHGVRPLPIVTARWTEPIVDEPSGSAAPQRRDGPAQRHGEGSD